MLDNDFKLDIVQRLTRIESNLPVCIKEKMVEKVAINRRLIFLILTLYATTALGLVVSRI